MLILSGILNGRQGRTRRLSLSWVLLRRACMLVFAVCTRLELTLRFLFQAAQKEISEGIGAQSSGIEGGSVAYIRRTFEQLGYLAEDGASDSIAVKVLEQQECFKRSVGG
jgi:hypothetical protein